MIRLGRFTYDKPVIVLAPMAGISDLPFRQICEQYGADFTVAEMISAKPDLMSTTLAQTRLKFDEHPYTNSTITPDVSSNHKADKPKIVQLVGSDPFLMAEAARMMVDRGADIIDINMGCPSKSVGKHLAGSALLGDEKKVVEILHATTAAVDIPVTLKTRIGTHSEHINITNIATIAEQSGIALLTVHGRTRAQKFRGEAQYDAIAEANQHVSIPVIVNGDITSAHQCQTLLDTYQFAGVMIGRAAQGNPWLFAECQQLVNNRVCASNHQPQQTIKQHIQSLHALYGKHALYIARKHLHWYYQNTTHYQRIRTLINQARDSAAQLALIAQFQPI